jgi:hypothetical protein
MPEPGEADETDTPESRNEDVEPQVAEGVLQPTSLDVAVRGQPLTAVWRNRALAVRDALPQLARNPVIAGASAAAATVVLRVAVEAVARRLGTPVPAQPAALDVTGRVIHHVHVFHHVRVVHHTVHHPAGYLALRAPLPPPPR